MLNQVARRIFVTALFHFKANLFFLKLKFWKILVWKTVKVLCLFQNIPPKTTAVHENPDTNGAYMQLLTSTLCYVPIGCKCAYRVGWGSQQLIQFLNTKQSTWLEEAKVERDLEREVPRGTGRCWEITSRVLPSQLSEDWLVVVESSVSLVWSMRRLVEFSRFSLRMSSEMLSPTLNTQRGRLSQPWMLSMLWRDRDVLCTDSEVKLIIYNNPNKRSFLGPQLKIFEIL